MNEEWNRAPAAHSLRMLLIKNGLSAEFADLFVTKLAREFRRGPFDREEMQQICVQVCMEVADQTNSRGTRDTVVKVVVGIMLGVAGNAVYDALKTIASDATQDVQAAKISGEAATTSTAPLAQAEPVDARCEEAHPGRLEAFLSARGAAPLAQCLKLSAVVCSGSVYVVHAFLYCGIGLYGIGP